VTFLFSTIGDRNRPCYICNTWQTGPVGYVNVLSFLSTL